jgi:anti-anti-sigma regulatory factor
MSYRLITQSNEKRLVAILDETTLDDSNCASFFEKMMLIAKASKSDLTLDFRKVVSIDSTGLIKLMKLKTCLETHKLDVRVSNLNYQAAKPGEISWLKEVFDQKTAQNVS